MGDAAEAGRLCHSKRLKHLFEQLLQQLSQPAPGLDGAILHADSIMRNWMPRRFKDGRREEFLTS